METECMNTFIRWIWEAKNIDEKNRRQAKKHYYSFLDYMNQLEKSSPGFQELWDISDFLNIIEYTYFYDNTKASGFWSDGEFGIGKTRFNIIKNNIEIVCTLDEKDTHITLTVKKLSPDKNSSSKVAELEFKNGQWASYKTEYDEILLDNIISIIWDKFIPLVERYYDDNSFYAKEQNLRYYDELGW